MDLLEITVGGIRVTRVKRGDLSRCLSTAELAQCRDHGLTGYAQPKNQNPLVCDRLDQH
jgi:hypothetical protein